MCFVTKATSIHNIDSKETEKQQNSFNQLLQLHFTWVVVYALTHTHMHMHTSTDTHTNFAHRSNLKKPGVHCTPGLKIVLTTSCFKPKFLWSCSLSSLCYMHANTLCWYKCTTVEMPPIMKWMTNVCLHQQGFIMHFVTKAVSIQCVISVKYFKVFLSSSKYFTYIYV